ncbi:MAG: UDP-N-acetylglucosamine 2-epimerase (non-hydrolyzing) [Ginsengibacter sp.]
MKVISIVGARPQFIKVAALRRAILKKNLQHFILHTGQHHDYNMSEIFFKELDIPKPDFSLSGNEPFMASSVSRMTEGIYKILGVENPDIVVVYGDTNSTLAGALAAKKSNLKLAHVEAGLRSYDNSMPEETNRIQTDKISDLLFCPTIQAVNNLAKEGFNTSGHKIILCGDIMLDAMNYYAQKLNDNGSRNKIIPLNNFILCTLHRESLAQSSEKLVEVIKALNEINRQISILMPAHPRLKKMINESGIHIDFTMIDPVGYLDMIVLLKNCTAVITDSGGLQKEAFFCKKPCVTVRNETEWTELADAGVNFIAGDSSANEILIAFHKAINTKNNFEDKFYGNGRSAEIIVEELIKHGQTS